jgi:DNA modification methylase
LLTDDEALANAAGFSAEEIEAMLSDLAEPTEIDEDEAPEPPVDPITKLGDLWILGEHRVLCGDSTKAEDVARLMGGEKADICFTSPPYALGKNVSLSNNVAMKAAKNAYGDHKDDKETWPRLMRDWFEKSSSAVSFAWVVNVQPLAGNKRELLKFMAEYSSRFIDVATWDKQRGQPAMASGVLNSRFEWLLLFSSVSDATRTVPLSSWRGVVDNVYSAPPQRENEASAIHAATMPVHVPVWVMQTLCDECKSVYEPFCGSGTTLIAAEQLGRKCYGMEISPQYCDVIVARWEKLTGQKAVLEGAS